MSLEPLPRSFGSTRESLRALACYVISPTRKARTGHISLEPTNGGFGTPPFDDGSRIAIRGDRLVHGRESIAITTLRAAAKFVGLELSPDPGVGADLPRYAPDADLAVDTRASGALGAWYAFANDVLDDLRRELPEGDVATAQLWPEHFDLAVTIEPGTTTHANVGFSPGDAFDIEPYVYVGPDNVTPLGGEYWNAPFGAFQRYATLTASGTPREAALAFIRRGLRILA